MDFDGFLYIFAVVGIAITAAAASLGVALVVTMARLSYVRFKLVAPLLFAPVDEVWQQRNSQERGIAPDGHAAEPVSKYAEKNRAPAGTNGGLKGRSHPKELDAALTD